MEIGAFAVFLSWMVFLLFIQKVPMIGIYVAMFVDVVSTFAGFIPILAIFVVGYSFAFHILLGNQAVFSSIPESFATITVMMIGELDYSDKFFGDGLYTKQISFVLFYIFLVIMTIIIMNLLVGLAVGDIIKVQEHATLQRLRLQVENALEVEFGMLPSFLRKKYCIRKEKREVNKYRTSNFIKRFLFEDSNLSIENITKAVDEEVVDEDETRTTSDRILSGVSNLKSKLADLNSDQNELKLGMRTMRSLMSEVRNESRQSAEEMKSNLAKTGSDINQRIDNTHSGLTETTQMESTQIRGKVDGTKALVSNLQVDVASTQQQLTTVKADLEERMNILQETILSSRMQELEDGLKECQSRIEKTREDIMESLEEMKIVLVREKYMTAV